MYVMQNNNNFFVYNSNNKLLVLDKNYLHLLNFASYEELNRIEGLLEIFFNEIFDFEKLRLKEDRPTKEETDETKRLRDTEMMVICEYKVNVHLEGVLSILKEMHPFFENDSEASNELESLLIDYFNNECALNEYVIGHRDRKDGTKIIKEYANLLNPILDDYLYFHYVAAESRKRKLEDAYDDYMKKYNKTDSLRRKIERKCKLAPYTIVYLHKSHMEKWRVPDKFREEIESWLDSVPESLALVAFQKKLNIWLKNLLDVTDLSRCKLSFNDRVYNLIDMLSANGELEERIVDCNLPLEIFVDSNGFHKRHIINSFQQLIRFQVLQMIQDKLEIRMCANPDCSKYFVVRDKREKYCNRNEAPSCEEIGKDKCKEKREEKPLYKEYRKAQSKYRTYVKRGDGMTEQEYNFWNEEAVRLRDEEDEDAFMHWSKLKKDEIACKYKESLNS